MTCAHLLLRITKLLGLLGKAVGKMMAKNPEGTAVAATLIAGSLIGESTLTGTCAEAEDSKPLHKALHERSTRWSEVPTGRVYCLVDGDGRVVWRVLLRKASP